MSLDGQDIWTLDAIQRRYQRYCQKYHVEHHALEPTDYMVERGWATCMLRILIERMKSGDLAAAEICLEMMEEDRSLAFGPIVKSNIPRAMAKCALTDRQKERIRERVLTMLLRGYLPKEFRQYAWLARRLGLGEWEKKLSKVDLSNPWAKWYVDYLTQEHPPRPPSRPTSWGL